MSTPSPLCAQIVAPYPPRRPHRHRQPVRQLRVVLHELRPASPASASAGPCRPATPPRSASLDYLEFYADDPETDVGLAYVEGIPDGAGLLRPRCAAVAERKPLVLVKGGATAGGPGPRPATPARWPPTTASSTARAARPASSGPPPIEEAFEAAATFATQPLPDGPERRAS